MVTSQATKNASAPPSLPISAIISGGSSVVLNMISNTPRIFSTAVDSMTIGAPLDEGYRYLKQLLDFADVTFVDYKKNDVVFRFNHRVVMGDDDILSPENSAQRDT